MPPAIHIMRQRPRPHLAKAVELGYIFNANNGVGHSAKEVTGGWWRVAGEDMGKSEEVTGSEWLVAGLILRAQF
jgi:hypothetical protein